MPVIPVYALDPMPSEGVASIFLAGPTPRKPKDGSDPVPSWRPEALAILKEIGFDGHVFIPEPLSGEWHNQYTDQVKWEETALHRADVILFWIPRDMNGMPALTTNDEWGYWKESGKVVLGCPDGAVHTSYQKHYANEFLTPVATTLNDTVVNAVVRINKLGAALRRDGELSVPLYIWKIPSFQTWYENLKKAGNVLSDSRVLRALHVGPTRFLFGYVLWADVLITAENRHKTNEFLVARPDISTIVLHGPIDSSNVAATEIVLVKEFRTPVNNPTGYVWEVAGGSSHKPWNDPLVVASEEVLEETGLKVDASRFSLVSARQMVATLSIHRAHTYKAELTADEIASVKATATEVRGVIEDTERTYTVIRPLVEILESSDVDWSMVGMILQAVLTQPSDPPTT